MDLQAPERDSQSTGPGDRLDSWKEIAGYLRRSPRTVQRWERQEGLPIHRLVHDKLGSVYAYRSELDAWWAERRVRLEGEAEESQAEAAADGEVLTELRQVPESVRVLPATPSRSATGFRVALGVIVAAAVVAGTVWWLRGRTPSPTSTERIRIAVLPFANLTGDPSRDFLSDGLTEELIAGLGRVRDLGVIARTSVMRYKGTDRTARQIARELGVDYLLEGSVRGDDRRLRVTAQLIRGSDEIHLWADSYDHEVKDLLRIETGVATRVAQEIRLRVPVVASKGLNPDAHLAYLRGRYYWNKRTAADFTRAIGFFEQAIAIDPSYAAAHSGLADSYVLLSNYAYLPSEEALPKAKAAANRALVLDDNLAEGHASLAFAVEIYDRDLRVAAQQFERALALNPNYATARLWYGLLLLNQRRFEEARAQFLTGLEADPFSLALRGSLASCDFFSGRYDAAITQLRAVIDTEPDAAVPHLDLGRVLIQKGDYGNGVETLRRARALAGESPIFDALLAYGLARAGDRVEADAALDRLQQATGERRVPPFYLAIVSTGLGRHDDAFTWLDRVLAERHVGALLLDVQPELAPLRADPRFQDLRRRAGLD